MSVYIAHIVLGMGALEELGWLQGRSLHDVALAVGLFASLATLGAWAWLRHLRHGPLEALMRRLCDAPSGLASVRR